MTLMVRRSKPCLGIHCKDILHLGRKLGPEIGEYLEAEKDGLKTPGNWNSDIYDDSYSSRLPMNAIRTFGWQDPSCCYIPRQGVDAEESLLRQLPIGAFAYDALAELQATKDGKITAIKFLELLCELNKIFIQEPAAMLCQEDNQRHDHALWSALPVFQSDEYLVSDGQYRAPARFRGGLSSCVDSFESSHQWLASCLGIQEQHERGPGQCKSANGAPGF